MKKFVKERTNGKKEPTFIFIKIREAVDVADLRIKEEAKGIIELRVHTTKKDFPKWYLHAYLIDLKNFNLSYKDIKDKHQLQDILLSPNSVGHADTRQLLQKLDKEFGGIVPDGSDKLYWRTEKFKKSKDLFQIKRKTL